LLLLLLLWLLLLLLLLLLLAFLHWLWSFLFLVGRSLIWDVLSYALSTWLCSYSFLRKSISKNYLTKKGRHLMAFQAGFIAEIAGRH